MKYLLDNFVLIYCMILLSISALFIGHEIAVIQHDADMRRAQKTVEKCQYIITKGDLYEKI